MRLSATIAVVLASVGLMLSGPANSAPLRSDGPDDIAKAVTLGARIAQAETDKGRVVHIIFVHGMRAEGRGASDVFRQKLLDHFKKLSVDATPDRRPNSLPVDMGPPPNASLLGYTLWRDEAQWRWAQPFVDRYQFSEGGRVVVVLDEVNWWPLLFPLKCKFIVAAEAHLSGVDKRHVSMCAGEDPDLGKPKARQRHKGTTYYPWLTPDEAARARRKDFSGGGAWANAKAKQEIMNWGLSDPVITLGPMRNYVRKAMAGAIAMTADEPGGPDDKRILISESLGSFAVMDALNAYQQDQTRTSQSFRDVMSATSDLYFFANQFPLLSLGRVDGIPATPEGSRSMTGDVSENAFAVLRAWSSLKAPGASSDRQLIAFSDPSDALTFWVPCLNDQTLVANVFDHNAIQWLGLFENPGPAHTGHSANSHVLSLIFGKDFTAVPKRDLGCTGSPNLQ